MTGPAPRPEHPAARAETEFVLPRHQRAVAEVVTRSQATIPAGFAAVRVDVEAALAFARAATRRLRTLVGLPELVVAGTARLRPEFPDCFAGTGSAVHVGVTIDVGEGLWVPVVHDAGRVGLAGVATELLRHRLTAVRGRFREAELSGATVMVSLATAADVTVSRPLVFPGQVCVVAVGGVRRVAGPDGRMRRRVDLGLSYDGRRVGERTAVRFLIALRSLLERAGTLERPETLETAETPESGAPGPGGETPPQLAARPSSAALDR